jgi:hypothetical protein
VRSCVPCFEGRLQKFSVMSVKVTLLLEFIQVLLENACYVLQLLSGPSMVTPKNSRKCSVE